MKHLISTVAFSAGLFVAQVGMAETFPPLAPLPPVPVPADNPMTVAKVELGKVLFFDPRLSGDVSTACVTCHLPENGWAFAEPLSRGYPGTVHWRNSQTVVNAAYLNKLFWAGAASSLERQAPAAAKGAVAGNGENDLMEARLAFIPEYVQQFKEVFGTEWPLIGDAWKAIAAFERTMVDDKAPLDAYLKGDKSALTTQQKQGMELFNGKAGCIQCHNGALTTDQKYHNIGVGPAPEWEKDGLAQITFRFEQYAKGVTQELYRKIKDDAGLYYRTREKSDMGKFRTPPLRYAKYTGPYMHNGSIATLKDVVEFYNVGGGENEFTDGTLARNKSDRIKPLDLNASEVDAMVSFLEAMSGPPIEIEEPLPPFYAPLPPVTQNKEAAQ